MHRLTFRDRRRGSLLISAMLLAVVIAISLGSYLALSRNSLRLANRSFYNGAALNLAETGLEEALWSFNQVTGGASPTAAWQGWDTTDGVTAKRPFTDFTLSGNNVARVKVYVSHYNPSPTDRPVVVAQSVITLPDQSRTLGKTIEVELRRRSKFAIGLVAKNQITFNGNNATVDSWNSDPDNDPSTAAIPYGPGVRNDRGSVGSTSVAVGSVAVNNADIWGFASVGSSGTTGLSVGSNGSVLGASSPSGIKVDTTRVATDFTANFDPVTSPGAGAALGAIGASLGTAGVTATYRFGGTINSSLTVYGQVTLILTTLPGTSAINLTGGDGLTLAAGSSLIIYTAGDVKIAGNGLLNGNPSPATFQLWATDTGSQDIQIAGNGALKGIVYAPNAHVKINGNGDVMGSIVANNITVTGNAQFHYDESLANWGANNPYGIVKWRELILAADRDAYAARLNF
jgi:Tfp pilus assembly protein PilX